MKKNLALCVFLLLLAFNHPAYAGDLASNFYRGWIFGMDAGASVPLFAFDNVSGPDGSTAIYDFDCHRVPAPYCGNGPLDESAGWLVDLSIYHSIGESWVRGHLLMGGEILGNLANLTLADPLPGTTGGQGSFESLMILPLSVQYHPFESRFNPYLTAGIGLGLNAVNLTESLQNYFGIGLPTTFVAKGGIGLDYILAHDFALNLEMGVFENSGLGAVVSRTVLSGSVSNGVPFNASAGYLMGGVRF